MWRVSRVYRIWSRVLRIYIEDLEAWEEETGLRVSAGDAIVIGTGPWARRAEVGPWDIANHRTRGGDLCRFLCKP